MFLRLGLVLLCLVLGCARHDRAAAEKALKAYGDTVEVAIFELMLKAEDRHEIISTQDISDKAVSAKYDEISKELLAMADDCQEELDQAYVKAKNAIWGKEPLETLQVTHLAALQTIDDLRVASTFGFVGEADRRIAANLRRIRVLLLD